MAIDLSGGLPVEREYFFSERPGPEVRDAANIWFEEENGEFALRVEWRKGNGHDRRSTFRKDMKL